MRTVVAVVLAALASMQLSGPVAGIDPTPTPSADQPATDDPVRDSTEPRNAPSFEATEAPEEASLAHDTFQHGDLFIGLSDGRLQWRLADGTLNREIQVVPPGTNQITGMAFDPAGNLLVTAFNADKVIRINNRGEIGGVSAPGALSRPESVAIDPVDGHVYVGQQSFGRIARLDYALNKTAEYTVTAEFRGADLIDFEDPERCILRYTSEDHHILRYNVCTQTQLANFPGFFNEAYDHRTMPDGGALVADSIHVALVDATGQRIRTYDNPGVQKWYGLALDPDGTSLWAGDGIGDGVVKFDIQSGDFLLGFGAAVNPPLASVRGLAVFDATPFGSPGPPGEQTAGVGSGLHGNNPSHLEADPVNTLTGNYVHQVTDLAMPGRGLPFGFARTYNSQFASDTGVLGPGWTHSFAARLELEPDGSVRFHAEDGAQLQFAPDGGGGFGAPAGARSRLAPLGGGYELTRHDQVRYRFDATGRLTSILDRNGNQLTFGYALGLLSTITDTVGRTLSLGYNAAGQLETLSGPLNLNVTYGYDPSGRLASVTDVRGGSTTYTYDAAGRLETIVDANLHTAVTNEYGPDGRITAQTDARGKRVTFAWDSETETSNYTDANSGNWIDDYDEGKLARQTDPLGNTTSYVYDQEFNMIALIDARGNATAMSYDAAGNLIRRSGPAQFGYPAEEFTYNASNDPLTAKDRRGNTTTSEYDAAGNLIKVTAPLSSITEFGRDPAGTGLLVSVTDPRDKTITFGYDGDANQDRITTSLGNVTTMTYDDAGRMLTRVEPRGNVAGADPLQYTTTFTYNEAGQLLTTTDPLANLTTRTYDDVGNLLTSSDANQHTTTYSYDDANHLASVVDAKTGVTGYAYDNVGNLLSRTDAKLHVTTYGFDLANRLTSTTAPLNRTWTIGYDPAGNPTSRIDANQNTVTYTYDALNRLTAVQYNDPATPNASFGYDANGNRSSVVDAFGTETYVYDAVDRLTSVTRGSDVFSYGYDLAGNITSRTYPSQAAQTLAYDDDGRLTSANGTTYTYDPAGNLLTAATADGLTARNTYDRAGRLIETAHTRSSGTLSRFTYGLDPVGNRIAMTTRQGTVTYRYDELNRLTEACWSSSSCPDGPPATPLSCLTCIGSLLSRPAASVSPPLGETHRSYDYDAVGNRQTEVSNAGTTTYTYDDADRLTTVTAPGNVVTSYAFDANGNETGAGATTFTYDRADRLLTATVGAVTETYTYWGDGVRRSASTGSQANKSTRFVWDRNQALPQLALERNGSDSLLRAYAYGHDVVSQKAGNKTFYYHHDGLGSVADITSSTGTSLIWSEYYPYGPARQSGTGQGAPTNPFNFTGEQRDATTGLYHLRARQYDPDTGRFLTADPLSPPMAEPYVTAYAYVRNNPCRLVDPSGLAGEEPVDWGAVAEVALKCGYGAYALGSYAATILGSAAAFASTLGGNPVGPFLGVAGVGVAVYNQEHTVQAMDWCFGGEVPSAPSTIGLPPNFPPRR